ncbi:TetR family transcriptional regulator [uncultured Pseudodesulfovibrio sp.]|uniref:TetR/AcrR family transcriptional regulator n=1 Tax=uncultured Pseudodesulfovibrio sp. TaxID=2035858 RepID=UPI0029C75438|nr:TetR family transcriptional regulator [uncultured Pseudodesulfovibrio sp.]
MSDEGTRERILRAASNVFCEKGFEKTTVRDICTEANANVAAVNYHFGDKKKLYQAVLTRWMEECIQDGQHTCGVTPETSPEERLRIYIRAELNYLGTHYDTDDIVLKRSRLLLREITRDDHDPMTFQSHLEHEARILHPIIRELVGELKDEDSFAQACIASTGMLTHDFIMSIHDPTQRLQSDEQIEARADFLTAYALGGLKAIKEKYHA